MNNRSYNERDPDGISLSIVSLPLYVATGEVRSSKIHVHRKSELLYPLSGNITVEADSGVWLASPWCGLWIPGGVEHASRCRGAVHAGCIFVEPDIATNLSDKCGLVVINRLSRELLLRLLQERPRPLGEARMGQLLSVLLDELAAASQEPLYLPLPRDPRLLHLVNAMIEAPSRRSTLVEWGIQIGASHRTLSRLFKNEVGMSFARWRQRLHVKLALPQLAMGRSVNSVALNLGYESTSAFIVMFRSITGRTPRRYLADGFHISDG